MTRLQHSLVLLVVLIGSGCASHLNQYELGQALTPGNGWLVISTTSPNPEVRFEIEGTEGFYKTPVFAQGNNLKSMQLPAGEYRISAVFDRAAKWHIVDAESIGDFGFKVAPGTATMVGEISFNGDSISLLPWSQTTYTAGELEENNLPYINHLQIKTSSGTITKSWALTLRGCAGRALGQPGGCSFINTNNSGALSINTDSI